MHQPKVAVVYHGQAGALQGVAAEVAAGAEEVGALVRIRRLPAHTAPGRDADLVLPEDVHWPDAVVLGSPSRYGNLAPPLRAYLELLREVEGDRLGEMVWSGFASADGVLHGGHDATLRTLFHLLSQLGGVVVPAAGVRAADVRSAARQTGREVVGAVRRRAAGATPERMPATVGGLGTVGAARA